MIEAIFWLTGLCFTAGCVGASFMAGVALAARWIGWAPVNVTVNVNDHRDCA